MDNITLDNGYKLTRSGEFQAKGMKSTLNKIAGEDGTLDVKDITKLNTTNDTKTAFFAKFINNSNYIGKTITSIDVNDLEDKMEKAWKKEQTQATPAPEPTKTIKETPKPIKPEKSSNIISSFFTVKGKSTDDIKIEGLKSMLILGAIGILGGPIGIIAGVGLGIALTAGKLIAKEIKDPEPINKPTITFDDEDLKDQAKAHDAKRGNRFDEKYVPEPNFLDTLKK